MKKYTFKIFVSTPENCCCPDWLDNEEQLLSFKPSGDEPANSTDLLWELWMTKGTTYLFNVQKFVQNSLKCYSKPSKYLVKFEGQ